MVYGEDYESQTEICGAAQDHDFRYTCATGIFMSLLGGTTRVYPMATLSPCDVCRFPATCFRFKTQTARLLDEFPQVCNRLDDYHADGCAYGMAYSSFNTTYDDVNEYCSRYRRNENRYLLCIDGFLTANKIYGLAPKKQNEICNSLLYPSSKELCRKKHRERVESMDHDNAMAYRKWEYDILEMNYDPNAVPKRVPWQVNWPRNFRQANHTEPIPNENGKATRNMNNETQ